MPGDSPHQVAALVTAFRRPMQTMETISKILSCEPPPTELLVHVDGGNEELAKQVRDRFPTARVFVTPGNIGPGASRNVLLREARCDLCASFDDESYPVNANYFARIVAAFAEFKGAWIVAGVLRDRRSIDLSPAPWPARVATFSGGACVYRKSLTARAGGYVPVLVGYGMEELDLSIRIHAMGGEVIYVPDLVVFHDSDLSHRATAWIDAATLTNIGLHCFLRYPLVLWPIGIFQVMNMVRWAFAAGRLRGVVKGLLDMPLVSWRFRGYRQPIAARSVLAFLRLKRRPIALHR